MTNVNRIFGKKRIIKQKQSKKRREKQFKTKTTKSFELNHECMVLVTRMVLWNRNYLDSCLATMSTCSLRIVHTCSIYAIFIDHSVSREKKQCVIQLVFLQLDSQYFTLSPGDRPTIKS